MKQELLAVLLCLVLRGIVADVSDCSATKRGSTESCLYHTCHNGDCQIGFDDTDSSSGGSTLVPLCVCDEGWAGTDCDLCCDKPCVKHQGKCDIDDTDQQYCACFDGYEDDVCSTVSGSNSVPPVSDSMASTTMDPNTETTLLEETSDPGIEVTPTVQGCTATKRGTTDSCLHFLTILTCQNGDCETGYEYGDYDYLEPHCVCDVGWTGSHCDVSLCCDRPCVAGQGLCSVDEASEQYCICNDGFEGEYCSNVKRITGNDITEEYLTATLPVTTTKAEVCNDKIVDWTGLPRSCHGLSCYHGHCEDYTEEGSGDTLEFGCICTEGWWGQHCDTCCDLHCYNGTCEYNENDEEMLCVCFDVNYTSESNCTELRPTVELPTVPPEAPAWLWPVVGSVVAVVLIIVLLLVLIGYYLWKKRYTWITKIVYRFQKYDDPNKPFHVFISYRSSKVDESFVLKMHKRLEKDNVRVCVHYKDFLPGALIVDNIMKAIEDSSRTILVISPDFCSESGEWPRFEMQTAHREMLGLRHRIVPIIFRNVDHIRKAGQMDPLLENILNTVTYLEWPGEDNQRKEERFWTDLKLAMPKVRPRTDEEATQCQDTTQQAETLSNPEQNDRDTVTIELDDSRTLPEKSITSISQLSTDSGRGSLDSTAVWPAATFIHTRSDVSRL